MSRIRIQEVLIVEGKYDAVALASLVDGIILTTSGFGIYSDEEKKELIRKLGKQRGLIILTDSDAAGFQIRHYVQGIAKGCVIKHAYIPAVQGKESRKSVPSKEGMLGVEGLPPQLLRSALQQAGATLAKPKEGRAITYTDLYEAGFSGGDESALRRREFLRRVGLPGRLSKKAFVEVLNSMYSYDEFTLAIEEKPDLFWDFHGTLTLPEVQWLDFGLENAQQIAPETPLEEELLLKHLYEQCLPWFTFPNGDTRTVAGGKAWWGHTEENFRQMYVKCGFSTAQAAKITAALRKRILSPASHNLYTDAIETLSQLQKRGYKSYVLSNNFPELEGLIRAMGLAPFFEKVIVSGEVGFEKPRKELFEEALRQAGNPKRKVMIGDNPVADVQGGKNAGFATVLVHCKTKNINADYCVDNLAELLEIFV